MAVIKNSIFVSGITLFALSTQGCTSEKDTLMPAKRSGTSSTTSAEPVVPIAGGLGTAIRVAGGVTVASTDVPVGGGFLVVYADGNGAPGARLGASPLLSSGVQESAVTVKIPTASGPVWLVLHRNGDGNETLDFPGADAPMNDPASGGAMVEQIAELAK